MRSAGSALPIQPEIFAAPMRRVLQGVLHVPRASTKNQRDFRTSLTLRKVRRLIHAAIGLEFARGPPRRQRDSLRLSSTLATDSQVTG